MDGVEEGSREVIQVLFCVRHCNADEIVDEYLEAVRQSLAQPSLRECLILGRLLCSLLQVVLLELLGLGILVCYISRRLSRRDEA